jgi:hypothetical protein
LKSNNIIYDEESQIPIIIDFGLSITLDKINPTAPDLQRLTDSFFDTYEYDYWCMEPIFIGRYAQYYQEWKQEHPEQTVTEYQQQILSTTPLFYQYQEILKAYLDYSFLFKKEFLLKLGYVFSPQSSIQTTLPTLPKLFHDQWQKYIENHQSDTLLSFFQSLWKTRFQWDRFSLSVIYLDLLSQLEPTNHSTAPQQKELENFTQKLINYVVTNP